MILKKNGYLIVCILSVVFAFVRCAFIDFDSYKAPSNKGYIYKATWNKSDDYLLVTSDGKKTLLTIFGECDNKIKKKAECATDVYLECMIKNVEDNDYGRYLMSKEVAYSGYCRWDEIHFDDSRRSINVTRFFATLRYNIKCNLVDVMGAEYAGIAYAVMTGSDIIMDQTVKDSFSDAGILHVLAVSGMHVSIIMKPVTAVSRNRYMGYKVRCILKILAAVFFMFLTDFSHSVVRAVLMFTYKQCSKVFDRPSLTINGIYFAAIIQLLHNPYVIYSVGFLLSYAAVLSISYIEPLIPINSKKLSGIKTGVAVNIGLIPLLMYLFGKISLIGIVINSVAGFISGMVCITGYVCGFVNKIPLLNFIGKISGALCAFFTVCLSKIAFVASKAPPPLGVTGISINKASVVVIIYVLIGIAVILCKKKQSRKYQK